MLNIMLPESYVQPFHLNVPQPALQLSHSYMYSLCSFYQ